MRVLMFSLDRKILEKDSAVQRRLIFLAGKHGTDSERSQRGTDAEVELTVIVPARRDVKEQVSSHLVVYGVGRGKIVQLWKMWREGRKVLSQHPPQATPFFTGDTTTPQPLRGSEGRRNYDLITVQDIHFLGFLAVKLAEKFSLPLEAQVHGFEKMRGVREWLARFVLRRADKIRVVSQRLKMRLAVDFGAPENKIYVLPVYTQMGEKGRKGEMGEEEKRGEIGKRRENGERGERGEMMETGEKGEKEETGRWEERGKNQMIFTFLTVGRLVPVKNVALQIRAFARLAKEYPQVRLRIVGGGPLWESLKFQVKSLKLEDKIEFLGYQQELGEFYEKADAFLLTSDYEGWGRVALEAAAYKLPIIMTNVGLANEVLQHNKECVVVPVGDEEQLYLTMKEFVERPELRRRLGEAALRAFKSLPSADEQVRKQVEEWSGLQ